MKEEKKRAGRNRTLTVDSADGERLSTALLEAERFSWSQFKNVGVVNGDYKAVAKEIPEGSVDLLFLDPPYNLNKDFNGKRFKKKEIATYADILDEAFSTLRPLLKDTATVYICGDWYSSTSIHMSAEKYFVVRNRVTWEREKGRGAKTNWKNSLEDIWFCTVSDKYHFDVDAVKLRRRVIAPYTNSDGTPKDWARTENGNFRDTHPSNFWNDITIPFWSMPENTDHPTQKSEKLLAKLLLASSRPGDMVLDPFLGSGTTAVVAKKLQRKCLGVEINKEYCLWALKRLELAERVLEIQGYADGVFWERNTLKLQKKIEKEKK